MRPTISMEKFASLKGGDLVLWRNKYLRTVLSGPGDKPLPVYSGRMHLQFTIRHRSWTNRAQTHYGYHDVKHLIRYIGKRTNGLALKSEVEVLKALRFDVRKELKREVVLAVSSAQRMGRTLCKGFVRIAKLARTI